MYIRHDVTLWRNGHHRLYILTPCIRHL